MRSATIRLDKDVTLHLTRLGNNEFEVRLDAAISVKRLTGDLSAIVTHRDLQVVRDSINKILED